MPTEEEPTTKPRTAPVALERPLHAQADRSESEDDALKFDPSKLYIGVTDFFSIMLPGSVLAYYLYHGVGAKIFGTLFPKLEGDAASWVVLIFAAYLLGHIVFLVGSYLDSVYDPIRRFFWKPSEDVAYIRARELKESAIPSRDGEPINTFQWSKITLSVQHPPGLVEVTRFEADSKFFRSLFVVLTILLIGVLWNNGTSDLLIPVLLLLMMALSLWRYVERRYKSTEQAYRYVIVLDSLKKAI